jgi:predicted porin
MSDVYEATVLLDTTVAGVGVRTSASYLHGNVAGTTGNRDSYSAGLSLSMAGFTLGGGYGRTIRKTTAASTANSDGWAYNIGLSYATGPYAVSLGYHHGEAEGNTGDNGSNEKYDTAELGFKYNVSSGIDFKSGVSYTKFSEDTELTERSAGVGEYESDGWVWVNGIYLSF